MRPRGMERPVSTFHFRCMAFAFALRDLLAPRRKVLDEAHVQPGFRVLDYGCGPGSYVAPLAELVGESGEVHALDVHPLAIERVQRIAARNDRATVKTILSSCETGLADESVDCALLYDTFHDLSEPEKVLAELHRVLKPAGALSFSDHHMQEADIVSRVTDGGLFRLERKGKKTYTFAKG